MTICPICLESIEKDKDNLITACKHNFHFSCIIKNIDKNFYSKGLNCPICRKSLLPKNNQTIAVPPNNYNNWTLASTTHRTPIISLTRINPPPLNIIQPTPITYYNAITSNITSNITRQNRIHQLRPLHARTRPCYKKTLMKKISKFTYSQLKEELKNRNLSTRGYLRDTLEKRLLMSMIPR